MFSVHRRTFARRHIWTDDSSPTPIVCTCISFNLVGHHCHHHLQLLLSVLASSPSSCCRPVVDGSCNIRCRVVLPSKRTSGFVRWRRPCGNEVPKTSSLNQSFLPFCVNTFGNPTFTHSQTQQTLLLSFRHTYGDSSLSHVSLQQQIQHVSQRIDK